MAEYITPAEARTYETPTGKVDLIDLISTVIPENWVRAESTAELALGQVAYVWAMGAMRRGVIVKLTKMKATVAFTTQGSVDQYRQAVAAGYGETAWGVRVQKTAAAVAGPDGVIVAPPATTEPEPEAEETASECELCGGPLASDGVCADDNCGADEEPTVQVSTRPTPSVALMTQMIGRVLRTEPLTFPLPNVLTLHSQAGKVGPTTEDETEEPEMTTTFFHQPTDEAETAETEAPRVHTGSTVVALIERVWDRIRAEHPELPAVVVTTGSGEGVKWGHFRPESWRLGKDGEKLHEFFLASEALAKGALQVLQTTVHEAAHTLSRVRNVKDTSRQHRYHNRTFLKTAEELGLEHKGSTPDKTHGFSFVTLTEATKVKYADLLAELEKELVLTGLLPWFLGGTDEEDEKGGEKITKPKGGEEGGETKTQSGNLKVTCGCEEPLIVRLSRKVLDLKAVECNRCGELFREA